MIHVGVLGFAHGHVMGYGTNMQNHPEWGVKITGGWDHDAQRAKDSCEKLGATAFATAEELLASDIQAVIVSCETKYHPDMVELAAAAGKLPTLELIAEVMLSDPACDTPLLAPYRKGGARGDMPYINFHLDFGAQGRPAFVPVEYMSFRDAVELVRDNGGVPVVAHPGLNLRGRERIVEKLLERGPRDWKFSIITTMIGRSPISRRWSGAVGP